jgi:hypothetical protein
MEDKHDPRISSRTNPAWSQVVVVGCGNSSGSSRGLGLWWFIRRWRWLGEPFPDDNDAVFDCRAPQW